MLSKVSKRKNNDLIFGLLFLVFHAVTETKTNNIHLTVDAFTPSSLQAINNKGRIEHRFQYTSITSTTLFLRDDLTNDGIFSGSSVRGANRVDGRDVGRNLNRDAGRDIGRDSGDRGLGPEEAARAHLESLQAAISRVQDVIKQCEEDKRNRRRVNTGFAPTNQFEASPRRSRIVDDGSSPARESDARLHLQRLQRELSQVQLDLDRFEQGRQMGGGEGQGSSNSNTVFPYQSRGGVSIPNDNFQVNAPPRRHYGRNSQLIQPQQYSGKSLADTPPPPQYGQSSPSGVDDNNSNQGYTSERFSRAVGGGYNDSIGRSNVGGRGIRESGANAEMDRLQREAEKIEMERDRARSALDREQRLNRNSPQYPSGQDLEASAEMDRLEREAEQIEMERARIRFSLEREQRVKSNTPPFQTNDQAFLSPRQSSRSGSDSREMGVGNYNSGNSPPYQTNNQAFLSPRQSPMSEGGSRERASGSNYSANNERNEEVNAREQLELLDKDAKVIEKDIARVQEVLDRCQSVRSRSRRSSSNMMYQANTNSIGFTNSPRNDNSIVKYEEAEAKAEMEWLLHTSKDIKSEKERLQALLDKFEEERRRGPVGNSNSFGNSSNQSNGGSFGSNQQGRSNGNGFSSPYQKGGSVGMNTSQQGSPPYQSGVKSQQQQNSNNNNFGTNQMNEKIDAQEQMKILERETELVDAEIARVESDLARINEESRRSSSPRRRSTNPFETNPSAMNDNTSPFNENRMIKFDEAEVKAHLEMVKRDKKDIDVEKAQLQAILDRSEGSGVGGFGVGQNSQFGSSPASLSSSTKYLLWEADKVAKMFDGKPVNCVACGGHTTVMLYENGEWDWTKGFSTQLDEKITFRKQRNLPGPVYIALGSKDRYYVRFADGQTDYMGSDHMIQEIRSTTRAVKSVAFGKEWDSYFIVYTDGTWSCNNIPQELSNLVTNQRGKNLDTVSLGPNGEYFLKARDGGTWWGGMTQQNSSKVNEVKGRVEFMDFAEENTFFCRYK